MTDKHKSLARQLLYAALMVLFIIVVERLRGNKVSNATDKNDDELYEKPYRPNTGELDF